MTDQSNLLPATKHLIQISARSMVARARIASTGFNKWLEKQLQQPAGGAESLISDAVIEIARAWESSEKPLSDLSPLLSRELVDALDAAETERMPKDRAPYAHQLRTWEATLTDKKSALVTAGTGAGKTECFLIPILQDCLQNPRDGGGVQAILLYPLNALIESQRERLAAWARGLGGNVRFALFNGDTPETEYLAETRSDNFELRSRERIRERPPEILVTNTTMLEYLLLRGADQPILQKSQGSLRWIVLDEAHSYAGSQAAEMALLLRRVRAGFGVAPNDVRLIATSATIGGEKDSSQALTDFAAALSGQPQDRVVVVEGKEKEFPQPDPSNENELDIDVLSALTGDERGERLAKHPRIHKIRKLLAHQGQPLSKIAECLFDDRTKIDDAIHILDFCAKAIFSGHRLLPWRAHVFHRAQNGILACINPDCDHKADELKTAGSDWPFGSTWTTPRAKCGCGAPVFEVVACTECGKVHLEGRLKTGEQDRLLPPNPGEIDDFLLDEEPEDDSVAEFSEGTAWLTLASTSGGQDGWLSVNGKWYDNEPVDSSKYWNYRLIRDVSDRSCCNLARKSRLQPMRFGPAFFLGNGLSGLLRDLAPPMDVAGKPIGGRRAISFSDSRQGVARLAAKLQQSNERDLTRAFLWHYAQEPQNTNHIPEEIEKLRADVGRLREAGIDDIADQKQLELDHAVGKINQPIPWNELINRLARHHDIGFAKTVWAARMSNDADIERAVARMFLYRELFRRPRIQNNPETMGLVQLFFPSMEQRALAQGPHPELERLGFGPQDWSDLAHIAVDLVFRNNFAIKLPDLDLARLINPRQPGSRSIYPSSINRNEIREKYPAFWPDASKNRGQPPRIVSLIYVFLGANPKNEEDQIRVNGVLNSIWQLIARPNGAASDDGGGGYKLDFSDAAIRRIDQAFLCPVTRRPYPYKLLGRSPNDPSKNNIPFEMPRLPEPNSGGLDSERKRAVAEWCETNEDVQDLRARGLWSDLHDRLAQFPSYVRAQEHSAQIPRPVLQRYERAFREGSINLLNCSTTMEMGVDLADVSLVVNTNVPPSLSNYRQRAGRAGRRNEAWAFIFTFCRNLPLDHRAFSNPPGYLTSSISAPRAWFESPSLIQRHVNAALLAAWYADRDGLAITGSIGDFFGATDDPEHPVDENAAVDQFLSSLDEPLHDEIRTSLAALVAGTALESRDLSMVIGQTQSELDTLVRAWRDQYSLMLESIGSAEQPEVQQSLALRANRLRGEFLLGELARRGFTPAYGFPTDVVTFENLNSTQIETSKGQSYLKRGTAARPLDQAIREYSPGAEIVIDGYVHRSDGILPAWEAGVDASRLEDLRTLWSCSNCHSFGWDSADLTVCPECHQGKLEIKRALRPAGFLGATPPHVGYENLAHAKSEPIRVSAQGSDWVSLPDGAGRIRFNPDGRVIASASGNLGGGFAICLDCGRAQPMSRGQAGELPQLPEGMQAHLPLLLRRGLEPTNDGKCPATNQPNRIQKNLHLAQVKRTDVWEWQLPEEPTESAARALAAALREALTTKLGVEPAEVYPDAGPSTSPTGRKTSIFLHDCAAGGAGLSLRLGDTEFLKSALRRAQTLLDCPDNCRRGCPSCILRPDLNRQDIKLDRVHALELSKELLARIDLPENLQIFGPDTQLVGQPIHQHIETLHRQRRVEGMDLWLHGESADWDFSEWPAKALLTRLSDAGSKVRVFINQGTLSSLELSGKLMLLGISNYAELFKTEQMPEQCGYPILAQIRIDDSGSNIVYPTSSQKEAMPNGDWGRGMNAPGLYGSISIRTQGERIPSEQLLQTTGGNNDSLRLQSEINGPISDFGKKFWGYLEENSDLPLERLREVGVRSIEYTDRYVHQPLTVRLLSDVIRSTPGKNDDTPVKVSTSYIEERHQLNRPPRYINDNYPTNDPRDRVLAKLLPGAEVNSLQKRMLPHSRSLKIELNNDEKLEIFFDHGFGCWRASAAVNFNFFDEITTQAVTLLRRNFAISMTGNETLIFLKFSPASTD